MPWAPKKRLSQVPTKDVWAAIYQLGSFLHLHISDGREGTCFFLGGGRVGDGRGVKFSTLILVVKTIEKVIIICTVLNFF